MAEALPTPGRPRVPQRRVLTVGLEPMAHVLLVAVALAVRLAALGERAMAHDESLHALYSWYLYQGRGFTHNPLMHGPFLFHANALIYFLLGVSDFTARLLPAVLGTALVAVCYSFRPWLGRVGALTSAALLAFSPSYLYYSRYIREDIPVALWTALMVLAVFGYVRTHRRRWLYLGGLAAALGLSTKEVMYIHGFLLVTFLLLWGCAEVLGRPSRRPLLGALASLDGRSLLGPASLFVLTWGLLHTTFLSNLAGLYTGSLGALSYWLAQHDVRRGGQPWYYYLLLLPLYEFLALFLAASGLALGGRLSPEPLPRRLFNLFLLWWLAGALLVYSWAGEKMPWLLVHPTMPLTFLAGVGADRLWRRLRREAPRWRAVAVFVGLQLLLAVLVLRLLTLAPFRSLSLWDLQRTLQWLAAALLAGVVAWLLWRTRRQLSGSGLGPAALLGACLLLALLSLRASWMANFVHHETAREPLVYAHATPDVRRTARELRELSLGLYGDLSLVVAYDDESTWPFEWYLKDFPQRRYLGSEMPAVLEAPVVIVGAGHDARIREGMGAYTRRVHKRLWWPLEGYKGLTWERIREYLTDARKRQELWDVVWWRRYGVSLGEWPLRSDYVLYVRRDLIEELWSYQARRPELLGPDLVGRVRLEAEQVLAPPEPYALAGPQVVALPGQGGVLVGDSASGRVVRLDAEGQPLGAFGSPGSGPGELQEIWGLAVGPEETVFVADTWNHRVQVWSLQGELLRTFGHFQSTEGRLAEPGGGFWGPRGLAFDLQGNLLVADTGNKRVQVFSPAGEYLTQFGGAGAGPGELEEPVGLAVDARGRIYVAEAWNRRIQVFGPDYRAVRQIPVPGWESASPLNKPFLAVDGEGRIYASDPERHRILVFSPQGELLLSFGRAGAGPSAFNLPLGLAVDEEGRLYVADRGNGRVLVFPPLGLGED